MAGAELGLTVFPLIIKNANLHGIGTGNRDSVEAMMACVEEHRLRPAIAARFPLEQIGEALERLQNGRPFGKVTVAINPS